MKECDLCLKRKKNRKETPKMKKTQILNLSEK